MVNRANQDWLAGKELRYHLMVLLLFLRMKIRCVLRLLYQVFLSLCIQYVILYLTDDK